MTEISVGRIHQPKSKLVLGQKTPEIAKEKSLSPMETWLKIYEETHRKEYGTVKQYRGEEMGLLIKLVEINVGLNKKLSDLE